MEVTKVFRDSVSESLHRFFQLKILLFEILTPHFIRVKLFFNTFKLINSGLKRSYLVCLLNEGSGQFLVENLGLGSNDFRELLRHESVVFFLKIFILSHLSKLDLHQVYQGLGVKIDLVVSAHLARVAKAGRKFRLQRLYLFQKELMIVGISRRRLIVDRILHVVSSVVHKLPPLHLS